MVTVVSEPLNPVAWTGPQQQAIYDELGVILGVGTPPGASPPLDLDNLSDQEIHDLLHEVLTNIKTRPTSDQSLLLLTEFEGDEIYENQNAALNRIEGALTNG